MNDLVDRLCAEQHPVEITLRPERTLDALRDAVERGYVHVKFTATRGGTELGFPLDRTRSEIGGLQADPPTGQIRLAGELSLDYERVRCIAEIDLATLTGSGKLERLAPVNAGAANEKA